MNERSSETHEVINSAVPGYSTFQQLRYLEVRGLDLKPDLIVLLFCLNDVVERYSSLSQFGGDNLFLGIDTRKAVPGIFGWFLRNSRAFESLARWARNAARDYQEYDVRKMTNEELSPELKEAWSLTLEEIGSISDHALGENIPFVLVIAPYRFQLQSPSASNTPQRKLKDFTAQRGIPVVDLLPPFASFKRKYPDVELFNDANHFSVFGHELTAQTLTEPLLKMLAGD
jgi:hypothetical protein